MFQTFRPAASTRFRMARKFSRVARPFPVWTFRYSMPICLIQAKSSAVTFSSTCIEILMPGDSGSRGLGLPTGLKAAAAAAPEKTRRVTSIVNELLVNDHILTELVTVATKRMAELVGTSVLAQSQKSGLSPVYEALHLV